MLRWESASVLAFFLTVKVMCALYRICLHIIFIFPLCAVAILDIYPSFHFLRVCVGFLTKLLRLPLTSLHPPLSCFSSSRVFSSVVCITIHFLCVHIKDDVGLLSSQSWVCIYRRLLGSEQQHHPRRWALKFILAKQEIKGFFFSLLLLRLHFLLLCSHLYFALQLRLSPFTCLEFRVLSNESSRSHGSKLFFPICCICFHENDSDILLCFSEIEEEGNI